MYVGTADSCTSGLLVSDSERLNCHQAETNPAMDGYFLCPNSPKKRFLSHYHVYDWNTGNFDERYQDEAWYGQIPDSTTGSCDKGSDLHGSTEEGAGNHSDRCYLRQLVEGYDELQNQEYDELQNHCMDVRDAVSCERGCDCLVGHNKFSGVSDQCSAAPEQVLPPIFTSSSLSAAVDSHSYRPTGVQSFSVPENYKHYCYHDIGKEPFMYGNDTREAYNGQEECHPSFPIYDHQISQHQGNHAYDNNQRYSAFSSTQNIPTALFPDPRGSGMMETVHGLAGLPHTGVPRTSCPNGYSRLYAAGTTTGFQSSGVNFSPTDRHNPGPEVDSNSMFEEYYGSSVTDTSSNPAFTQTLHLPSNHNLFSNTDPQVCFSSKVSDPSRFTVKDLHLPPNIPHVGSYLKDCQTTDANRCDIERTYQHISESSERQSETLRSPEVSPDRLPQSPDTTGPPSNVVAPNCQVCGDISAGFHCGAFVCEACKKFFIRAAKNDKKVYKCPKNEHCVVTKKLRTLCQYCRYQKCLQLGMYKPGEGPRNKGGIGVIPCRVCAAPSSGFHFGAITCEGCKGFFRRMVKEREITKYECPKNGLCQVTQSTRNTCKACRYQKCLQVGMSAEGSRIGRQPNAIKHATLLEMQNQLSSPSIKPQQQQQNMVSSSSSAVISKYAKHSAKASGHSEEGKESLGSDPKQAHPDTGVKGCSSTTSQGPDNRTGLPKDVDIFCRVVQAGKELEAINTRPEESRHIRLEDFRDINSCWKYLMTQFTKSAHEILRFAKKIPGFRTLTLDDQATLLRTAMYPIMVLCLSHDFNAEVKSYNYFNFTERERDLIFHFIPGFISLKKHFLRMGEIVTMFSLDNREYDFLSALILLSPDEGHVTERDKVWAVQENIAAEFQEYEERNYKDGGTRFGVVLARLAEFRMMNLQHQQIVSAIIKAHPSFQVPQLFSELFLNK